MLKARSRTLSLWRKRIEAGNEPEKELWLKKSDFKLKSGERSGTGPESELFRRQRTRSWSRRERV